MTGPEATPPRDARDRPLEGLLEAAREACLAAAIRAHEDAGLQGLCSEGRWEAAVSAIRDLDLRRLLDEPSVDSDSPG